MDLILEYTLSASAVAKGFSAYFAALFGFPVSAIRLEAGIFALDFLALFIVIIISLILCRSTAESSIFNISVNVINLVLIAFVIFVGLPHSDVDNWEPFSPFGIRGVFSGASVVFFSFIGFDTVATTAEETRNPARDLPIGEHLLRAMGVGGALLRCV